MPIKPSMSKKKKKSSILKAASGDESMRSTDRQPFKSVNFQIEDQALRRKKKASGNSFMNSRTEEKTPKHSNKFVTWMLTLPEADQNA